MRTTVKTWADIRARRFSAEELLQIDQQVQEELLEMEHCVNGKRIKLAEG